MKATFCAFRLNKRLMPRKAAIHPMPKNRNHPHSSAKAK